MGRRHPGLADEHRSGDRLQTAVVVRQVTPVDVVDGQASSHQVEAGICKGRGQHVASPRNTAMPAMPIGAIGAWHLSRCGPFGATFLRPTRVWLALRQPIC
jgi:phage FluMu protein gp41